MEAHKAKMNALTQELEALQLELQTLGPQKLRGSTASLTASSAADHEDEVENVSEAEYNPSQHQHEVNTEMETKVEIETKDDEAKEEVETSSKDEIKDDNETKDNDSEIINEVTT